MEDLSERWCTLATKESGVRVLASNFLDVSQSRLTPHSFWPACIRLADDGGSVTEIKYSCNRGEKGEDTVSNSFKSFLSLMVNGDLLLFLPHSM